MEKFEMIEHFENCFDAMKPAEEKSNEAFAWFSGLSDVTSNIVTHLFCDASIVERKVDELIEKSPSGIYPSFWIHSENRANGLIEILKERGYKSLATFPVMVWAVNKVAKPMHKVQDGNLDVFWQIVGSSFQYNDELIKGWQKLFNNLNTAEHYLVYLDGEPVGAGTLFLNGNVGVISNIATLPKYQKRGCGRSIMLFLMNRAYELQLEFLILGGSPMSEKLYSDLGFKKEFDIEIYAH